MLIAVMVDRENKLASSIEDTKLVLIFDRKFERVRLIESKPSNHKSYFHLLDAIKGCKYIVSSFINAGSEISNTLTDLGIKIVNEVRTKDPYYAIRLI